MSDIGRWERKKEHRQYVSNFFKDFYSKNPVHNKVSDRTRALEEGRKYYISPTSCKKCGCVIRYVKSYGCHFCIKKKGYEKLMSGDLNKYKTPEKTAKRVRKWRENNYEKYRDQWLRDTTGAARSAQRRTTKRNQTPDLTPDEKERIKQIYLECGIISEETGIQHHVDHIIPISKGGLHHPDNLQILTAHENLSKGAKLEWH